MSKAKYVTLNVDQIACIRDKVSKSQKLRITRRNSLLFYIVINFQLFVTSWSSGRRTELISFRDDSDGN